ncbi:alginate lyase family protein [Alphaproteobacteria bacterium]|nr:alginate lyase family protein [Alphaproteobacteria bacterium]
MAKKFFAMPVRDKWIRLGAEFGPFLHYAPPGEREEKFDIQTLLNVTESDSLDALHKRVIHRPMPWKSSSLTRVELDENSTNSVSRIMERAEAAMGGWVCLMGSGPVQLGEPHEIDWYRDAKSGLDWPFQYFHSLDVADLDRDSDVKFPWELSRLQWLMPMAQAWVLTGEHHYAAHLRTVLEAWFEKNPTAWGVNWSCTMEPAMRVIVFCWLYQMVGNSPSWSEPRFRVRFLSSVYLHLQFIRRYLEITDVNGNHLTADAAALVVGGAFLGGVTVKKWSREGWRILKREIELQVYPDGVDFEGSVPYHRLVAELFHVAGAAEKLAGGEIPQVYKDRLLSMAQYTEAYTRPDGLAPSWGDGDDARILPMDGLPIQDHRYLPSLIRAFWSPDSLTEAWRYSAGECLWWWGKAPHHLVPPPDLFSKAFFQGGSYILRQGGDYVFFDCGPLGLSGRGGHGHNDMLAFESTLDGVPLIADPGCPVYTGDWQMRNQYRSTRMHSTIQVGEEEINRFISPKNLWFLREDAKCQKTAWYDGGSRILIQGQHTGYERLTPPVKVMRTLLLVTDQHALIWCDNVIGARDRPVAVTLQFAAGVEIIEELFEGLLIESQGRRFRVEFRSGKLWALSAEKRQVSLSYGVLNDAQSITWLANSWSEEHELTVAIYPVNSDGPIVDGVFVTLEHLMRDLMVSSN